MKLHFEVPLGNHYAPFQDLMMELGARLLRNPELPPAPPQQQQQMQSPSLATLDPPLPPLALPGPNWALPVNVTLIASQPAGAVASRDADRSDTIGPGDRSDDAAVSVCPAPMGSTPSCIAVIAPPMSAIASAAAPESPSSSDHWLPPPAGLPAAENGSETAEGGAARSARRPSGAPELVLELPGIQAWHQADISLGLPKVRDCAGAEPHLCGASETMPVYRKNVLHSKWSLVRPAVDTGAAGRTPTADRAFFECRVPVV